MRQESHAQLFAIALALLIITAGLLLTLIFVMQQSHTADTNPSINVENALPTVDSVIITDTKGGTSLSEINLVEGTTTTVYVEGIFTDLNDCTEVTTSSGMLYVALRRDGVAANACNDDVEMNPLNCYISSLSGDIGLPKCTTTCTAGSQSANYSCTFDIEYYADATDTGSSPDYSNEQWEALVAIRDYPTPSISDTVTSSIELNSLVSLLFSSGELDYGALDLGATSSIKSLQLLNKGNYQGTDMDISGTDLTCSAGTISVGQQKFGTTSLPYLSLPYTHMDTAQSINMNMGKQQSTTTEAVSTTFWSIVIPSSGLGGTCQGTTIIQGTTG